LQLGEVAREAEQHPGPLGQLTSDAMAPDGALFIGAESLLFDHEKVHHLRITRGLTPLH
jgi:hypothetical protein